MKYSIIIPCYNEKSNIEQLVKRVLPLCGQAPVEFILVENGSTDGSRETFRETVEGKYADIPGLCKIASIAEVEEKNWSLTPGAYVGVAEAEDDGVDFAERMHEIHAELLTLQKQSNELMEKISANFKELGI